MTKMIVSVEEVEALQNRQREINAYPLENIQWTKDGRPLEFSAEEIENWKFIGLTNIWFISSHNN